MANEFVFNKANPPAISSSIRLLTNKIIKLLEFWQGLEKLFTFSPPILNIKIICTSKNFSKKILYHLLNTTTKLNNFYKSLEATKYNTYIHTNILTNTRVQHITFQLLGKNSRKKYILTNIFMKEIEHRRLDGLLSRSPLLFMNW